LVPNGFQASREIQVWDYDLTSQHKKSQ